MLRYSLSICYVPVAALDTKDVAENTLDMASILMRLSQYHGPEDDALTGPDTRTSLGRCSMLSSTVAALLGHTQAQTIYQAARF